MAGFLGKFLFGFSGNQDQAESSNSDGDNGNAGVPVPSGGEDQEASPGVAVPQAASGAPLTAVDNDGDDDYHYFNGDDDNVASARVEAMRQDREEMRLMHQRVVEERQREEQQMTPEQRLSKQERLRLQAEQQKAESKRLHRDFKLRMLREGKVYTDRPAMFEAYPYTTPHPLRRFFDSLDYQKTVIAGSYALHSLMTWRERTTKGYFLRMLGRGVQWQPDDVDIMIKCDSKEEFDREAQRIEGRVGGLRIIKDLWIGDGGNSNYARRQLVKDNGGNFENEDFHNYIRGVKNYRLDGFGKKIQLVCMSHLTDSGERLRVCGCDDFATIENDADVTVVHILDRITDYPACVTAKITRSQEMQFRVPVVLNEVLRTMQIPYAWICQYRRVKYGKRGFTFRYGNPGESKTA